MLADSKIRKALNAANDALHHLSSLPDNRQPESIHIDRMLAKIVDLPTETKQKNSRRNLWMIRQWMFAEGPGVIMLEVLGQICWRLADMNGKELENLKAELRSNSNYITMLRDSTSTTFVVERIKSIQKNKSDACLDFIQELELSENTPSPPSARSQSRDREFKAKHLVTTKYRVERNTTPSSEGLIKVNLNTINTQNLWANDLERLLVEFYIHGICPGRTLLSGSNTHLHIVPLADKCPSVRFALLSLSASYLKYYLAADNGRYEEADHYYGVSSVQSLTREMNSLQSAEAALATAMLLVHHDTINQSEDSNICWSVHFHIFNVLAEHNMTASGDAALFLRHQVILACTFQVLQNPYLSHPQFRELSEWNVELARPESKRICGTLGLSEQLLFIISSVTSLVAEGSRPRTKHQTSFLKLWASQLIDLQQWTTEVSGKELEVVNVTAECFRVAAQIYLECRAMHLTRFHPTVKQLNKELCRLILCLPVSGPLYTATYPIWPFFIATVTCDSGTRDKFLKKVLPIIEREKTSFSAVLERLLTLRPWLESQRHDEQHRDSWWEDMTAYGTRDGRLLCLG